MKAFFRLCLPFALLLSLSAYGQNSAGVQFGYDSFNKWVYKDYRINMQVFDSYGYHMGFFYRSQPNPNFSIKYFYQLSKEFHKSKMNFGYCGDGCIHSGSDITFVKSNYEILLELNLKNFRLGSGLNFNHNLRYNTKSNLLTDGFNQDILPYSGMSNLNYGDYPLGNYQNKIYFYLPVSLEYRVNLNEKISLGINSIFYKSLTEERNKMGTTVSDSEIGYVGNPVLLKQNKYRLSLTLTFLLENKRSSIDEK